MSDFVFIVWQGFVHLVTVRTGLSDTEAYEETRAKLQVPEWDVTPWGKARFKDGVAKFNYCFAEGKFK